MIYVRAGTKGLLLRTGQILRELNRSFYHAAHTTILYVCSSTKAARCLSTVPIFITSWRSRTRKPARSLTCRSSYPSTGFFHSRLSTNPSGTRLVSAGWVWTPVERDAL